MDKTGAFLEHQLGCEVGDQCNYFGPVSLGLHYYYHLDSRWGVGLAYQLSPACMEVGNRVRFFMEWGYGQEGVFTIGLSTRI
jgi:hypothetical protein